MSSGGPSQLGTYLIQRLDTLLGLTQSQQLGLGAKARPNAVFPTDKSHPGRPLKHSNRGSAAPSNQAVTQTRPSTQRTSEHSTQPPTQSSTAQSSAQMRLGRTAQLIMQLLDQHPDAPPIKGRSPLLDATGLAHQTTSTQHIQRSLQQELLYSGLFYESLLHERMRGQRKDQYLYLRQPHNQIAQKQSPTSDTQHELPKELRPIIRQQLELLATHQWEWRGELWPGVEMVWYHKVDSATEDPASPQQPPAPQWRSSIRLHFALDEHISIDIQWSAQQLDIYLYASPTRAQKLKPLTPQLEKRLSNINPNTSIYWRDQPFELALEKDTQPHANMTQTTRTPSHHER